MPVTVSRRTFLRGGLASLLAAWNVACAQSASSNGQTPSAAPITPNPSPATIPAPTLAPAYPPAVTAEVPSLAAYPAPSVATVSPTTFIPTVTNGPTAQFSGERALEHAKVQMQWVPRDTGSDGWKQCGDYIAAQVAQAGWKVENQQFPYQGIQCRNIIGKRGSGPRIIFGAHYDSRRRADQDRDESKRSQPVPAANDGASGIAVLLELARVLQPEALGREIWLVAFDAEDNGDLDGWEWIVGSTRLANSLTEAPQAVIVVDMIGDADQQLYYEGGSDPAIREAVWKIANELGFSGFIAQPKYTMIDDHSPFLQKGYRAIDIIDFDYPYWHTTQDTLDKISAPSLEAVGKTLETWLLRGAPGI